MTRLNVAFVVPAGFLGCLTMSAALVVGHAEISQLRPHERRSTQVVETAESPFRVITGVRVPDPAPSRTSVPSPSAATVPGAATARNDLPRASEELLPPAEIPSEVPEPSWVRRRADALSQRAPRPARGPVGTVVSTAFDALHRLMDLTDYPERRAQVDAMVHPAYESAVSPTRPTREAATADAQQRLEATRG